MKLLCQVMPINLFVRFILIIRFYKSSVELSARRITSEISSFFKHYNSARSLARSQAAREKSNSMTRVCGQQTKTGWLMRLQATVALAAACRCEWLVAYPTTTWCRVTDEQLLSSSSSKQSHANGDSRTGFSITNSAASTLCLDAVGSSWSRAASMN